MCVSQSSVSFVSSALFDFMSLCEGPGLCLRINSWMVNKLSVNSVRFKQLQYAHKSAPAYGSEVSKGAFEMKAEPKYPVLRGGLLEAV